MTRNHGGSSGGGGGKRSGTKGGPSSTSTSTRTRSTTTADDDDVSKSNDKVTTSNHDDKNQKKTKTKTKRGGGLFSVSCGASVLMVLYMGTAFLNFYHLMYPLSVIDVSNHPRTEMVGSLWEERSKLRLKVYLSSQRRFTLDFVKSDPSRSGSGNSSGSGSGSGSGKSPGTSYADAAVDTIAEEFVQSNPPPIVIDDTVLLWEEEEISEASLSRSFLLTTIDVGDGVGNDPDCIVHDKSSQSNKQQQKHEEHEGEGGNTCAAPAPSDPSYQSAVEWLDRAERKGKGGFLSDLKAGEGIESTSILLKLYDAISTQISNLMIIIGILERPSSSSSSSSSSPGDDDRDEEIFEPKVIPIPPKSRIWSAIQSNSTLHLHVVLMKLGPHIRPRRSADADTDTDTTNAVDQERALLRMASQMHSLLLGNVGLVKYEPPHHVQPPGRILWNDVSYVVVCLVARRCTDASGWSHPPWDMEHIKPVEYRAHQQALSMQRTRTGYPYFKPQVSIKYINDDVRYPQQFVGMSGMEIVQISKQHAQQDRSIRRNHPTGIAIMPAIHVDEIGLTSEKYIPINDTLTTLPLRITLDRSDVPVDHDSQNKQNNRQDTTSGMTAGSMSPARWRLLSRLSESIESQKEWGFEQSDIDDVRRLIADTNVTLLLFTILASGLHLLFEFLTFKNEVSFWSNNKDLTGLSVRSLFLDMAGQIIILLYLIEKDSSLLMTIPMAFGCLIALWKCQRAAGLRFIRVDPNDRRNDRGWWNIIPRWFGYELRATRLEITVTTSTAAAANDDKKNSSSSSSSSSSTTATTTTQNHDNNDNDNDYNQKKPDLAALSIETDRMATRILGSILLPLVVGYTLYSFLYEEHVGWYSWLITSASSAVYALGFVLMTPQLFLNYRLKSVAHLPWKVLVFKFLNTFIDDLFAFIIRMPTMARLSCFRDDIVFFVYLYQRWLYPVDESRPTEGGGDGEGKGGNQNDDDAATNAPENKDKTKQATTTATTSTREGTKENKKTK